PGGTGSSGGAGATAGLGVGGTGKRLYFSDLLQRSLCKQTRSRAWNATTSAYAPIVQQRVPQNLPPILAVHCAAAIEVAAVSASLRRDNPRGGAWLPEEIEIVLRDGGGGGRSRGTSSEDDSRAAGPAGASAATAAPGAATARPAAGAAMTVAAAAASKSETALAAEKKAEPASAVSTVVTGSAAKESEAAAHGGNDVTATSGGAEPRAAVPAAAPATKVAASSGATPAAAPAAPAAAIAPTAAVVPPLADATAAQDALIVGERVDLSTVYDAPAGGGDKAQEEWYHVGVGMHAAGAAAPLLEGTRHRYRLMAVISCVTGADATAAELEAVGGAALAAAGDGHLVLHARVPQSLVEEPSP
ncbi:unnamed protein product, partial [Phaeothamnion confervicola]